MLEFESMLGFRQCFLRFVDACTRNRTFMHYQITFQDVRKHVLQHPLDTKRSLTTHLDS